MEYDNTNRGALFKNERKDKDTHPDYNGTINVDGKDYWLNAWLKEGKKGKFFSLSVKPKDTQPSEHSKAKANVYQGDDMEEGIPF